MVCHAGLAATSTIAISSSTAVNHGFVTIKVTPKAASAMATRPSNGIREWGLDAAG